MCVCMYVLCYLQTFCNRHSDICTVTDRLMYVHRDMHIVMDTLRLSHCHRYIAMDVHT